MYCSNPRFHFAVYVHPAQGVGPMGPYACILIPSETAVTVLVSLKAERAKDSLPHGRRSLRRTRKGGYL